MVPTHHPVENEQHYLYLSTNFQGTAYLPLDTHIPIIRVMDLPARPPPNQHFSSTSNKPILPCQPPYDTAKWSFQKIAVCLHQSTAKPSITEIPNGSRHLVYEIRCQPTQQLVIHQEVTEQSSTTLTTANCTGGTGLTKKVPVRGNSSTPVICD